ncbi:hypothetical protein BGI23_24180 [Bacillus sp. ABP14]|nr:hypothetical protein BGI23_24180 [Bacillus sp. ABP14]
MATPIPSPAHTIRKRPAQQGAFFIYYPVPAARMFGGFTSSYEAKSASTSEAPSPSHSGRAASTLNMSSFAS